MPSLVARLAENAFWLGRYIERTENVARILDVNETFARDHTGFSDWERILKLYSDKKRFKKVYDYFDDSSVLKFYVLDTDNPTSLKSSLRFARDNARAIRHLISTEMWWQLNTFYNETQAYTKRDIQAGGLPKLCRSLILGCQSFEGIAEGTLSRGEVWAFYQLGKQLERADQTTRLLDMSYDRVTPTPSNAVGSVYWDTLLRSVCGYHAFRYVHPVESSPEKIAAFLLYDHEFPRAVALCVHKITARIGELEQRYGIKRRKPVEKARNEAEILLNGGLNKKMTSARLHGYLDQLQSALGKVSQALEETYFQ